MENPVIYLDRMVFKVTSKCSLKCKLCLAYIPYYEKHEDVNLDDAKRILSRFFKIIDSIGSFTLTGGEPLLNKHLSEILLETLKYSDKIIGNINIVTNGTIEIKHDLLDVLLKNKHKVFIIISNYGPLLSKKIPELISVLSSNGIPYRIEEYYDDTNLKYGGWIDYRDHSLKHFSEAEIIEQASKCIFRQGHYYEINNGELHLCSRSFYRMMKGIINKNPDQYIDLLNPVQSIEADKEKMISMNNLIYLDSCAYCFGNVEGIKRYKPAEQLIK